MGQNSRLMVDELEIIASNLPVQGRLRMTSYRTRVTQLGVCAVMENKIASRNGISGYQDKGVHDPANERSHRWHPILGL